MGFDVRSESGNRTPVHIAVSEIIRNQSEQSFNIVKVTKVIIMTEVYKVIKVPRVHKVSGVSKVTKFTKVSIDSKKC